RQTGDGLPRSAWAYLLGVVLATAAAAVPALTSRAATGSQLFHVALLAGVPRAFPLRRPRRRRRGGAVLPRRRRLVPRAAHRDRVRDRRRDAPPARARGADGDRPAPAARVEAAVALVHPGVQHRELHAGRARC